MLTDIDMPLIVEKGIRGRMCYTIHRYTKANNKYIKDYDPNKRIFISHVLGCQQLVWLGDVTKVACWWFWMEKRQVYVCWRIHTGLQYDEDSGKGYKLKVDVKYLKDTRSTQWYVVLTPKNENW